MSEAGYWREGSVLPTVRKSISQESINRYADATGDFNPIHVDPAYASRTPLRGTVAHGMMILAYVSQMMMQAFGRHWAKTGRLDARFKTPARPGDTVIVVGRVENVEKQQTGTRLCCGFRCENQKKEPLILGEASVKIRTDGGDRWS